MVLEQTSSVSNKRPLSSGSSSDSAQLFLASTALSVIPRHCTFSQVVDVVGLFVTALVIATTKGNRLSALGDFKNKWLI
jgi:hypothetical protein